MAIDVSKLPGPGSAGRGAAPEPVEPDGDEYGTDDDQAAEVSLCQDVMDALKGGDAEEACSALKAFISAVTGPSKV